MFDASTQRPRARSQVTQMILSLRLEVSLYSAYRSSPTIIRASKFKFSPYPIKSICFALTIN